VAKIRVYTVEEANRELPKVRRIVGQIVELTTLLPELEDQARIAEYDSKRPTGNSQDRERMQLTIDALSGAEHEHLKAIAELNAMGIQLKDPLTGLVDFPCFRDGELVELCWRLGEERVAHWHRIDEGYVGRKPL